MRPSVPIRCLRFDTQQVDGRGLSEDAIERKLAAALDHAQHLAAGGRRQSIERRADEGGVALMVVCCTWCTGLRRLRSIPAQVVHPELGDDVVALGMQASHVREHADPVRRT